MSERWSTIGGQVTQGECFAKLTHHLREAQEQALMLGHLAKANDDHLNSKGWLGVGEMLGNVVIQVTKFATGRLQ